MWLRAHTSCFTTCSSNLCAIPKDTPSLLVHGNLCTPLSWTTPEDVQLQKGTQRPSGAASSSKDSLKARAEELLKKKCAMQPGFEKQLTVQPIQESRKQLKKQRKLEREKTKGKEWFDLPAAEMTEEKKRDLEILQMRDSLDPKRFYKSNDRNVLPKYFQVGTVVDQAIDFYTSRVPKKQRKNTLLDELMADKDFQRQHKRRYAEVEERHQKSRKGAFRKKTFQKKKKRKTEQ